MDDHPKGALTCMLIYGCHPLMCRGCVFGDVRGEQGNATHS